MSKICKYSLHVFYVAKTEIVAQCFLFPETQAAKWNSAITHFIVKTLSRSWLSNHRKIYTVTPQMFFVFTQFT